ncbi:MAG: hypothetical protein GEV03_26765 [Streptosporangiales bacterium]|nr:hypothetical protein [Streptosporangiales bacterium]
MRRLVQVLGVVMVLQGVGGIVGRLFFPLPDGLFVVTYLPFLAGYEIFANLVMAVLGVVMLVAADRTSRGAAR